MDNNSNDSTEDTAALSKKYNAPKTGEKTPVPALFVLMLASGAVIVAVGKKQRMLNRNF